MQLVKQNKINSPFLFLTWLFLFQNWVPENQDCLPFFQAMVDLLVIVEHYSPVVQSTVSMFVLMVLIIIYLVNREYILVYWHRKETVIIPQRSCCNYVLLNCIQRLWNLSNVTKIAFRNMLQHLIVEFQEKKNSKKCLQEYTNVCIC